MITFTGVDTIFISDSSKAQWGDNIELLLDVLYRADSSVVAIMYVTINGTLYDRTETAYTASEVDSAAGTETDITAALNEAVHILEKLRLETINGSATFTITL